MINLVKLLACFIPQKEKRHQFREKYDILERFKLLESSEKKFLRYETNVNFDIMLMTEVR